MTIRLRLPGPMRWSFPDDAVIEYEPETGAQTATGIQTATIKAAVKILLDSPEVECATLLITEQLEVKKGGTMKANISVSDHRGETVYPVSGARQ